MELVSPSQKKSDLGDITKIVYSRHYKGIEIIGSEIIVNMDNEGRVFEIIDNYQGEISGFDINRKMSSKECGEILKKSIGLSKKQQNKIKSSTYSLWSTIF